MAAPAWAAGPLVLEPKDVPGFTRASAAPAAVKRVSLAQPPGGGDYPVVATVGEQLVVSGSRAGSVATPYVNVVPP